MSSLQEQLARAEQKFGPDSRVAQSLRQQVVNAERWKAEQDQSGQEVYLTGSVSRLPAKDQPKK